MTTAFRRRSGISPEPTCADRPAASPVRFAHGFLAATLLLSPGPARAHGGDPPRLALLRVAGTGAVAEDDVRAAAGLPPGTSLTDSTIAAALEAVTRLYRDRAYYGASVTAGIERAADDGLEAALTIRVREGVRATFGALGVRGAKALTPGEAGRLFPLSPGDPFDPRAVEAGVSAILGWYDRAGYPFASAAVDGIADAGGGTMTVTIGVTEGAAAEIGEIRVEGNTETRDRVVLREARMDLPSAYDPAALGRFAARLRRLGIFSSVAEPSLYRLEGSEPGGKVEGIDRCGLLVSVAEGRTSSFDAILGYAPGRDGDGALTGSVVLAFRNLLGTGRRLDAAWTRPGPKTQEVRLGYDEPWLFGFPVNAGGGFSQRRQDTTYVDTRWRLSAEFLVSSSLSVAGVLEGQGVVPSTGPGDAAVEGTTTTTGGAVVRYDARDDRVLPRSGVDFRSEYRTGRRRPSDGGAGTSAIRHIGFDFDLFIPVGGRQVVAFGAHGREVSTDSPGPADLYRLGGFRTLRGFREEQFAGEITAWGSVEFRYLAGGASFLYGFFDPGYVLQAGREASVTTFGYGVGARLETGIGLVGVSFALGEGDPVSRTKIHFGLINDF